MMSDTEDAFLMVDDAIPNFEKLNSSGFLPTFDSFNWDDLANNALTKPKMSKVGTSATRPEEAPRRIRRKGDGRKTTVDSAKRREVTRKAPSKTGTASSKKTSSRKGEDLVHSTDPTSEARARRNSRRTKSNSPVRRASSASLSNSRRSSVSPVRREHRHASNSPQSKREAGAPATQPSTKRKNSTPVPAGHTKQYVLERKNSAPASSKSPIRTHSGKKVKNKTRMGDMDGSRSQRGNPNGRLRRGTSNPSISPVRTPLVSNKKGEMDTSRQTRSRGGGEMDTSRRQRRPRRDANNVPSTSLLTADGTANRAKDDMDVSSLRRRNRRRESEHIPHQRTMDDMDVSAMRRNRRRSNGVSPTGSLHPKAEMDTSSQRRRRTPARRTLTGDKKVGTQSSQNRASAPEERHVHGTVVDASSKTSKTSKAAARRSNSAAETTPEGAKDGSPSEGGSNRSGRDKDANTKRSPMRSQAPNSDTQLSLSPNRGNLDLSPLTSTAGRIPAPQSDFLDYSLFMQSEEMLMDSSQRSAKDDDLMTDSSHRSVGVARHPRRRNNKGNELMKRTLQRLEISNHVPQAFVQGSHLGGEDSGSDEDSDDGFGGTSSKPTSSLAARLERHKTQRDTLSSSVSVGGIPSGTKSGDDLLSSRSSHGTRSRLLAPFSPNSSKAAGTSAAKMMGFSSLFKGEETAERTGSGSFEFSVNDTEDYKPKEGGNEEPTNIFSPFE